MSATMSSVDFSTTEDDTKGRQRRSSRPFIVDLGDSFFPLLKSSNNLRTFDTGGIWDCNWMYVYVLV